MCRAKIKEFFELAYWKYVKFRKKEFNNNYYKDFFTTYFTIDDTFYNNKSILDVGCGPRGSLEWADMASERIGLDPLADKYVKLTEVKHKMNYVKGYLENLPFENNYFDVVSAFNALDHVEDLKKATSEIKRVLKQGGLFLLIVNIHRYPTLTEPHTIGWDYIKNNFSDFEIIQEKHLEEVIKNKIYQNLRVHKEIKDTEISRTGVLTALLKKRI